MGQLFTVQSPGFDARSQKENLAIGNYLRKLQLLIKVILIFDILWGKSESMLALEMHIAH